jgi:hypothetical protein
MSCHLVDHDLAIGIESPLMQAPRHERLLPPAIAEDLPGVAPGAHLSPEARRVARTSIARARQGGAR